MNINDLINQYKSIYVDKSWDPEECPPQEWYLNEIQKRFDDLTSKLDTHELFIQTLKENHFSLEQEGLFFELFNRKLALPFIVDEKDKLKLLEIFNYEKEN